jgi:hypothetical protein
MEKQPYSTAIAASGQGDSSPASVGGKTLACLVKFVVFFGITETDQVPTFGAVKECVAWNRGNTRFL